MLYGITRARFIRRDGRGKQVVTITEYEIAEVVVPIGPCGFVVVEETDDVGRFVLPEIVQANVGVDQHAIRFRYAKLFMSPHDGFSAAQQLAVRRDDLDALDNPRPQFRPGRRSGQPIDDVCQRNAGVLLGEECAHRRPDARRDLDAVA
jgi:hypothetical protein